MRTRHALAGALVALALTAAACGGDDSGSSSDTVATTGAPATTAVVATTAAATTAPPTTAKATTTTAKPTTTTAAVPATLMDLINKTPQLAQLGLAITSADLNAALKGTEPLTIFAPSNDAFAKLGTDAVNALNRDPAAATPILTYHVVPGKLTAKDLASGQLTTLNGAPLTVVVDGDTVTVNGAKVTKADLLAGNGVIHIIDTVLTPPAG